MNDKFNREIFPIINFGTEEKRKIWHLSDEELRKIRKDTRDAITLR